MRRAVEDARERQRGNRRRIVARLQQAGEPLLPQPFELVFRERRPQRDVGHDRQRVGEPRDRHVQPHGRRIEARSSAPRSAPRKSTASAISSAEREPAPSSSIAAVRLATPNLPAGSSALPLSTTRLTCATGTSCSSTIHTGRPFESCLLLDRRQLQRRRRPELRRLRCDRAPAARTASTREQRTRSADARAHERTRSLIGLRASADDCSVVTASSPARRSARRAGRAAGTARRRRWMSTATARGSAPDPR